MIKLESERRACNKSGVSEPLTSGMAQAPRPSVPATSKLSAALNTRSNAGERGRRCGDRAACRRADPHRRTGTVIKHLWICHSTEPAAVSERPVNIDTEAGRKGGDRFAPVQGFINTVHATDDEPDGVDLV